MFGRIVKEIVSEHHRWRFTWNALSPVMFWAWVLLAWIILSLAAPLAAWRNVVRSVSDVG